MKLSKKTSKIIPAQKWRHTHPIEQRYLAWGNCGFKLLETLWFLRRRAFWMKRWLKWHYKMTFLHYKKKKLRKRRYYWFHIKRCIPCSRKSDKMRMGKGRGKLGSWYSRLNAGNFVLEFKFAKEHVLRDLYNYFRRKFVVKLHCVFRTSAKSYSNFNGKTTFNWYYTRREFLTLNRRYRHIRGYYYRLHDRFV